jgi:hypothetical protein
LSNIPKIVRERLRAAAPEKAWPEGISRAHPDPDLLTAFTEQALPPAERESVLRHLALCGDCREVVALALPVAESVATSKTTAEADDARAVSARSVTAGSVLVRPQRRWFAAPAMRWAALAAGIVVAGAIILTQSRKPNQPIEAIHPVETATPEPAAATAAKPAAPAQANSELALSAEFKPRQKTVGAQPNPQRGRRSIDEESRMVADLKTAPAEAVVAGGALQPPATRKDLFAYAAPASPSAASAPTPSAKEAVVVNGAGPAVNTEDALVARNEQALTISKAKTAMPAMDEAAAPPKSTGGGVGRASAVNLRSRTDAVNLLQAAPVPAQWQVAAGALQRSLDRGATWQTSLRPDHPLLCFAALGNEIWAGGKAGALFHSADGGANWTQINPSADGRSLSADITRIETRSPTEIVLATSSGESWTTLDGGKSWVKK